MKYIIHSKSERGFWNNQMGWVNCIDKATIYDNIRVIKQSHPNILTKDNDAEWMVYKYE